jgi:EAL domain-containing protein (putative c-di-GMP-specific phosphodiesterase class I)
MVVAKQRKSGYVVYDPAAEQQAPNRLALLGDLRRAIDADDQIVVHYQPKVGLDGGRLVGVEALVRWQHPQLGRLAPDAFIPMAETTALIIGLTGKVLDIAVRQARQWSRAGLRIPVAVNLSTRCLHDPALADRVLELLDRHGVPPALLELEITESMVMVDPDRALQVLRRLHEAGIRISVDDFGTGHSSMAYLKELPVDELKIDRSFVLEMTRDGGDAVLVQSAIALGHNLGLSVVAEGVETPEVLAALDALGCDVAQGFHLGRPMPAEEFEAWLAESQRRDLAASA